MARFFPLTKQDTLKMSEGQGEFVDSGSPTDDQVSNTWGQGCRNNPRFDFLSVCLRRINPPEAGKYDQGNIESFGVAQDK
jgi:hypothetical protein